ncbi:MAG: hypothetical protein BZ137_06155 [Methanosphaera sp. rholeuAM130]|nr:MAG: hypothetical protein BZ137_06155 [Methanosphaera sp. rholeuAM130]
MASTDNGQLLSLDLLLYLVALSMVVALSLYIYLSFDASSSGMMFSSLSDERLDSLEEALFKTPGNPANWQMMDSSQVSAIGLCVDNDSYLVSYDKLIRLKNNPDLIYTIFPSQFKCNVILEPVDNPTNRINIVNSYSYGTTDNVLVRRVPIIIDYGYDISPIESNNNDYNCPYNHLNDDDYWSCKSFNVTRASLATNRYYIISKNADVILSNTYGQEERLHITEHIDITDKLNALIHHEEDTIYIHVHSNNNDSYLVSDKNNRIQHLNSVIAPERYTAILEVST